MSAPASPDQCPDEDLEAVIALARRAEADGLAQLDHLVPRYPLDARLRFLRASLLAGLGRYAEAVLGMQEAVDLAPGFALARFQLGLLQLTSGEAQAAEISWGPLATLPIDDPIRLFAEGLVHLAHDRFPQALTSLQHGVALNTNNAPLNADMRLVMDEIVRRQSQPAEPQAAASSAAHLLLQMYGAKPTKH